MDTRALGQLSVEQLQELSRSASNRQMSIVYSQLARAKECVLLGDHALASAHLSAAKRAYTRSLEDDLSQVQRALATHEVVVRKGDAQDGVYGPGKQVVKLQMQKGLAVWKDAWARW